MAGQRDGTLDRTGERFETTTWSQIQALATDDVRRRRDVLDLLVRRYWPPVYAYLRAQGRRRDDAAEMTQAFFAEVVLGRRLFDRADPARGRLRTLLLTALGRFGVDRHRRAAARPDSSCMPSEALDQEDARLRLAPQDVVHRFEKRWALGCFEEALRRCEAHFRRTRRDTHWRIFETHVLEPAVRDSKPPPLELAAAAFGFRSAALAAAAVQVVKRRASVLLREVVAETIEQGADLEDELAELRRHLHS